MRSLLNVLAWIESILENIGRCYIEAYGEGATLLSLHKNQGQSCPLRPSGCTPRAGNRRTLVDTLRSGGGTAGGKGESA